MKRMTEDEARQFIEDCRSPAIATVVRKDGRPHASPIWIYPDGDEIVFTTYYNSVKAKALARDPRMTLLVQDEREPYHFAMIEGHVTSLKDDLPALKEWAGRLGGRYLGQSRVQEFAERNGVPGELLGRFKIELIRGFKNITS